MHKKIEKVENSNYFFQKLKDVKKRSIFEYKIKK